MEKTIIEVCNMVLSGYIPPKHLNDFLQNVLKYRLDLWSYQDHPKVYYAPLSITMMMGKVNELRVFLRYGFEKTVSRLLQLTLLLGVITEAINRDNKSREIFIPFSDVERFLQNVDPVTERKRRLVIETFAVASFIHTGHVYSHPISFCYEIVWMTTPEPYVKHYEMFQTMILLCGTIAEQGILGVCETFRKRFGKDTEGPREPRSLKHLCRCTIRRVLTKTFQLPHSIDALKLPDPLKDYIRLDF